MFWIILLNEINSSAKNFSRIIASFLFFIIFLFLAQILLIEANQDIKHFAFWLAATCCLIFSSADFLKKEYDNGFVEQMLISCHNFESFIFAKIIANWLNYGLPIILAFYLIEPTWQFIATAIIATIIINIISCFCGSFALMGNSSPLIAVIALPLIIPVILVAQNYDLAFKILLPLCLALFFFLSYMTAKIIKILAS